jgi:hypothetical protein
MPKEHAACAERTRLGAQLTTLPKHTYAYASSQVANEAIYSGSPVIEIQVTLNDR